MSKAKPLSKSECIAAAKAVFEARVIVERYLQQPQGKLDTLLQELEMDYYRHADASQQERKARASKVAK
jgi:hypothetical protein